MLCWFLAGRWGSAGELSLAVDSWAMDNTHIWTHIHEGTGKNSMWGPGMRGIVNIKCLWTFASCQAAIITTSCIGSPCVCTKNLYLCLQCTWQGCGRTVYQGIECYIFICSLLCNSLFYIANSNNVCIFFFLIFMCSFYSSPWDKGKRLHWYSAILHITEFKFTVFLWKANTIISIANRHELYPIRNCTLGWN